MSRAEELLAFARVHTVAAGTALALTAISAGLVASATLIADREARWAVAGLAVCGGSAVRGLDVLLPDAVYLQRHGDDRYVLPHRIDHLANMRSLAEAGCDRVLALGSVGGLHRDLVPGTFVCPTTSSPWMPARQGSRTSAHTACRVRPRAGDAESWSPGATGSVRRSSTEAPTGRPAARGWRRRQRSA